jgi:hypothetical protein
MMLAHRLLVPAGTVLCGCRREDVNLPTERARTDMIVLLLHTKVHAT